MPRVTIGVPVYNGARLIGKSLKNLAEQSFTDFEVIVSDNASTDGTTEICEDFARRDRRFRVIRRATTSVAMQNFLAVRREANSPLYMWRAFDDLSTPNYLEALVGVHAANPGIALAAPAVVRQFGPTRPPRRIDYLAPPNGPRVLVLLQRMMRMPAGWFYGLWTLQAAERATEEVYRHFPDDWGADYLAMFHAALNGGIAGTNACEFHQLVWDEFHNYIPRPKPSLAVMVGRNRRFWATCNAMIDAADLNAVETTLLRAYLPIFTNRCSHRTKRILKAALLQLTASKTT